MSKKLLGAIIAFISLAAIAGIVLATMPKNQTRSPFNGQNDNPDTAETKTLTAYTLQEVAIHDNKDDCWTIIDDKVYDITAYIPRHPGGDEILRACGTDGSSLFNERKTDDGKSVGSGAPHSSSAKTALSRLQVGTLKK